MRCRQEYAAGLLTCKSLFSVEYLPGVQNNSADCLSRLVCVELDENGDNVHDEFMDMGVCSNRWGYFRKGVDGSHGWRRCVGECDG